MISVALLAASETGAHWLGRELSLWSVVPFGLLLAAIALGPLAAPHFWERNRNKARVSLLLSAPVAAYLVGSFGAAGIEALEEKLLEYVSFIILLGSLFVICGGIYVEGSLSGTPLVNTGLMAFGAVLASLVGTTGASMLLIRPLLRANAPRERVAHVVVFFILIVSNCGGLLTPLGDPPLFLGFLNGVPFGWTLSLWKQWLLVNGGLLVIFHVWDQVVLDREERERPGSQLEEVMRHEPLRVRGCLNLVFLLGIVGTVYASGRGLGFDGRPWPAGLREGAMLVLTAAAYASTGTHIRTKNAFTFRPIVEVAVLFAGIFVTMTPALLLLNTYGAALGVREPWQYFWATGLLSSVLDNAPTYLTFAAAACGQAGVPLSPRYLEAFLSLPASHDAPGILAAISCGAVFMGANTYIGNGPNFMVKAIAEASGVRMPGFFGYIGYSALVAMPLFAAATWLFFLD